MTDKAAAALCGPTPVSLACCMGVETIWDACHIAVPLLTVLIMILSRSLFVLLSAESCQRNRHKQEENNRRCPRIHANALAVYTQEVAEGHRKIDVDRSGKTISGGNGPLLSEIIGIIINQSRTSNILRIES